MGRDGVDTRVEMAWVNKARREREIGSSGSETLKEGIERVEFW